MVMAYMMVTSGCSMAEAVSRFTAARGRQPACTPTYWTALLRLERNMFEGAGAGVPPTFDFTDWICDDLGGQGEEGRTTSLQIATDDRVAHLLQNEHDWDADAVVQELLG